MDTVKKTVYNGGIMDTQNTENKAKKKLKRKPRGRKIRREQKNKKKIVTKAIRGPRKIGYMRVSTEKQEHTLQYDALIGEGIAPDDIFQDTISGSKITREGRDACLKFLIPGDKLYVWKLDRFSRSLLDILTKLQKFEQENIGFVSITQNLDTTTPMGKLMVQIMGAFAEFERETIRERVKAGIKAKRESGEIKQWGRKPSVEYNEEEILHLLKENSIRKVSKITGVPKSTVGSIKKRNEKNE